MRLHLSLPLTYVQICGTLACVTSTNSRLQFAPTPLFPYSCSLFVVAKKVNSFGIKQIQTLFPKHPGWGIPTVSLCSRIRPARIRVSSQGARNSFPSHTSKFAVAQVLCLPHIRKRGVGASYG